MQEKDCLVKLIDYDKQIRVYLASTRYLVNEACQRHECSATAAAALGRTLTAAALMASDLKAEQDLLTLRINGNGLAGTIMATANSSGEIRGFISEPQADLPSVYPGKLAVGELVGKDGYLEVVRDLGLKQPFTGRVKLVSGEIAEDLAEYYFQSEQIRSLVALGVLVDTDLSIKSAGGLLVQALPGAQDEILDIIENNISLLGPISSLMLENSLEQIIVKLMQGIKYEILQKNAPVFKCNCSRERLLRIISGLGDKELESLALENGQIEIICNYCREKYYYTAEEIRQKK